jgi:hypothetical protein
MKIEMYLDKSTKNTHVYSTQQEDAAVQTLYIKKPQLSTPVPTSITVEITENV